MFILDEPTRGLHCSEVRLLMAALRRVAHKGNTVVVVEHDLGIVAGSDHVIDLGPGGGSAGGRVVYTGRPSGLVRCDMSVTGRMLRAAGFFGQGLRTGAEESVYDTLPALSLYRQAREAIRISGARRHNLKDISVEIPHGSVVVITGVSGSGKSTLAFDCIFSEGQRRYVEGLSSYMRQFVTMYQRPDVDSIAGLTPSVAIEQRTSRSGSMSTVATLTETAHYLRLLYARAAVPWCTRCGVPMSSMTRDEIVMAIMEKWRGRRIMVAAPRITRRKGYHLQEIDMGMRHGISRFFIDGHVYNQQALPSLSRYREHSVSWITGDVILSGRKSETLTGVVARALETGHGIIQGGRLFLVEKTNRGLAVGEQGLMIGGLEVGSIVIFRQVLHQFSVELDGVDLV
jgi:excinuclease ABC subunit A